MTPGTAHTIVLIAVLVCAGGFLIALSRRVKRADPARYQRAQRLTDSYKNAVLGSVGWREANLSVPDVDCGMVSREIDGQITIIRQARLAQDTISGI